MMKNLADLIMVIDDVIPAKACADMIEHFENTKTEGPYKRTSIWEWEQDYRTFVELNVGEHQDWGQENLALYNLTVKMYNLYREKTNSTFLLPIEECGFEAPRMKKYEANDHDQFGWHADVGNHASARRELAMFIYLNDVEEGGETVFKSVLDDDKELRIIPKCGRIVIFPPQWMFPHKGNKPISGPKYIVSMYTHYL
jgi:hypothetical protein